MGCAASKNMNMDEALIKAATEGPPQEMSQVQATATTEPETTGDLETEKAKEDGGPGPGSDEQEEVTVLKKEPMVSTNSLEKPVMPEIRSSKLNVSGTTELPKGSKNSLVGAIEKRPERPVAFEIPVDELKPIRKVSSAPKSNTSTKPSLPKLDMSEAEIAAKLLNAEDRWKDLEKEDARKKSARSRRGASARSDPEELKTKLEEKEAKAEQNRQRELAKKQSEQEKRDSHIKKVRERKRQMGNDQAEEPESEMLNLSWGGETGGSLMDAAGSSTNSLNNEKSQAET